MVIGCGVYVLGGDVFILYCLNYSRNGGWFFFVFNNVYSVFGCIFLFGICIKNIFYIFILVFKSY